MDSRKQHIEEILESLNEVQRAQPAPFMHTRIMAKLENQPTFWNTVAAKFARPGIAIACLTLVLVVNISAIFWNEEKTTEQQGSNTAVNSPYTSTDDFNASNYLLAAAD